MSLQMVRLTQIKADNNSGYQKPTDYDENEQWYEKEQPTGVLSVSRQAIRMTLVQLPKELEKKNLQEFSIDASQISTNR